MATALQRTVRRVAALLLLQLGTISAQLYEIDSGGEGSIATFVAIPLFVGAFLYLLGSVVWNLEDLRDPPESVRD
jgi:hypothetical protein